MSMPGGKKSEHPADWEGIDPAFTAASQVSVPPESLTAWKPLQPLGKIAGSLDITEASGARLAIGNRYYQSVLDQARRSFACALTAVVVGTVFFFAAVIFLFVRQPDKLSYITFLSGALIDVISALCFYLYARTSSQLLTFHERLEGEQRYIDVFKLADAVCDKLEGDQRGENRAQLVQKIADFPVVISRERAS